MVCPVFMYQKKRKIENIIIPTKNDVLFGRGGKNSQHSGNEYLRNLCRKAVKQYKSAKRRDRYDISLQLVRKVRSLNPPGRFLRQNEETDAWEEVTEEEARSKASQSIRDSARAKGSIEDTVSPDGKLRGIQRRHSIPPTNTQRDNLLHSPQHVLPSTVAFNFDASKQTKKGEAWIKSGQTIRGVARAEKSSEGTIRSNSLPTLTRKPSLSSVHTLQSSYPFSSQRLTGPFSASISEKKIDLLTTLLTRTDTISFGNFVTSYISNSLDSGSIRLASETTPKMDSDMASKSCGTKYNEKLFDLSNDISECLSNDMSACCDHSLPGDLDDALDALKDEDNLWTDDENNSTFEHNTC